MGFLGVAHVFFDNCYCCEVLLSTFDFFSLLEFSASSFV